MTMATVYARTLEQIAKPFIENGLYKSRDAFVKDLVKDIAAGKVRVYQKQVKAYEARHGSFERFSHKIGGRASPKQEDQWMEWKAARDVLKAWKQVARELGSLAS